MVEWAVLDMGLSQKAVRLSDEIRSYLQSVQEMNVKTDVSLVMIRGEMLHSQLLLLQEDLQKYVDDKEIGATALQICTALDIEKKSLEDVTKALKTAGNTKRMLEELRTAAQIKSIQERLKL